MLFFWGTEMCEYMLCFVRIEWAAASLLLGNPSLAGISSFLACRQKIHLCGALLRRVCGRKKTNCVRLGSFALCGERPKGFQPSGHLTSASRAGAAIVASRYWLCCALTICLGKSRKALTLFPWRSFPLALSRLFPFLRGVSGLFLLRRSG